MHLRWTDRPHLEQPVIIAAWEGWNDAGDAATSAAAFLARHWDAEPFADIDPEEFYDFTVSRPEVEIIDGDQRQIVFPSNTFSAGTTGSGLPVIVLEAVEPQLKWRTYCAQVVEVARQTDARLVLTFGALLAEVAHSRPVAVYGTAYDPAVIEALGLETSTYEGPTGIVGMIHNECAAAGVNSASLWAAVPSYVSGAPSPKAALALVEHGCALLGTSVPTTELEIASAAYERQVTELVEDDDQTSTYVRSLEEMYDAEQRALGSTDDLLSEVERFLRDQ